MCIRVLSGQPRAGCLERDQLRDSKSQDCMDRWSVINSSKERVEELGNTVADPNNKIKKLKKDTEKLQKEVNIAKEEVVPLTGPVHPAQRTAI